MQTAWSTASIGAVLKLLLTQIGTDIARLSSRLYGNALKYLTRVCGRRLPLLLELLLGFLIHSPSMLNSNSKVRLALRRRYRCCTTINQTEKWVANHSPALLIYFHFHSTVFILVPFHAISSKSPSRILLFHWHYHVWINNCNLLSH